MQDVLNNNNNNNIITNNELYLQSQLKSTEDFYIAKIKQLQSDYTKSTHQRENELEDLFTTLSTENTKLKQDLIEAKFQLEKEKEISLAMKETYFNLNSFDEANNEVDHIVYENIKQIKAESDLNLNQIEDEYNQQLNSFKAEFKQLRNALAKIIEDNHSNGLNGNAVASDTIFNHITEDIIDLYEKKLLYLLEDSLNKAKYTNNLTQKNELAIEENNFLRNCIMREKTVLVEKINEMQMKASYSHFDIINDLIGELTAKKKNYFNEKFKEPIEQIKAFLEQIANENETLKNDKENIKAMANELRATVERLNAEKDSLLQANRDYIQANQRKVNMDANMTLRLSQLETENKTLKEKYDTLLNDMAVIKLKNEHFNNEIDLKVNEAKRDNIALITIKDSLIAQLNKEIANKEKENTELQLKRDLNEKQIEEQTALISDLEDKNQKATEENAKLKTAMQKAQLTIKMCDENMTAFEYLNQTLEKKNEVVMKEKEETERKYSIINNKYNALKEEYSNLKVNATNLTQSERDASNKYNEATFRLQQCEKEMSQHKEQLDLLHNIQEILRQIYQCNFPSISSSSNDNQVKNEITMLKELNEKISQRLSGKCNIPLNEPFKQLEQSKNSQLYESIILFIINLKSHNSLDIFQALNDNQALSTANMNNTNTNANTQISINARSLEELRFQIEEKYAKYEKRIANTITIQDFETIILDAKSLYEQIIDKIIQSFYKHQRESQDSTIVTFQMPLDKYNQIISNLHSNLEKMSKKLNSMLDEYKRQGGKIESALSLLMKHISL